MRLLMYIEQFPEVVISTLENNPATKQWFHDEWIHLVVLHPESKLLHRYVAGKFVEYHPLNSEVRETTDINHLIETSTENLPVYILKS
jgi:uncharacterized protein